MTERESPYLWSTTALSNQTADPSIDWQEGQLPGTVNGSARGMMAAHARYLKDNNASLTTTGSANAYALTINETWTAYATGKTISCKASFANTAAATLNITNADSTALGAKAIRIYNPNGDDALSPYMITSGAHLLLQYDAAANSSAGAWILLNPFPFFYSITDPSSTSADLGFTGATTKKGVDILTTFSSSAVSGIGLCGQLIAQSGSTGSFQAVHGAVDTQSESETYGVIGINATNSLNMGGAAVGAILRDGLNGTSWTEDTGPSGMFTSNETVNPSSILTGFKTRAGLQVAHSAADGSNAFYFGMDVLNPASAIVRGDSYLGQNGRNALRGRYSRGANTGRLPVHDGDVLLQMEGYGFGTSAYSTNPRATLELQASQTWTDAVQGTKVIVKTTPTGGTSTAASLTVDDTQLTLASGAVINFGTAVFANVVGNFIVIRDGTVNGGEIGMGNASQPQNQYSNTSHIFQGRSFGANFATIDSTGLSLNGSSSGTVKLAVPATAGSNTITLPAGTTNFSATGGTSQVVKQTSAGGAFTVAQLAASDLSNGTTGTAGTAVVLATSPTLVTPTLGAATATSINKVAITAPASSATLTIADGKTLTVSNTLTLAGTDSTTMTFPSTSGTVATLNTSNTFTAAQTISTAAATMALNTTPTGGTASFTFSDASTLKYQIGSQNVTDFFVYDNAASKYMIRYTTAAGGGTLKLLDSPSTAGGVTIYGATLEANYILELPNSASQKAKANAWDTYSDGRLKPLASRASITNPVAIIKAMRPLEFDQHEHGHDDDGAIVLSDKFTRTIGFIAQDEQERVPWIVNEGNERDTWSMDYAKVSVLTVAALQDLIRRIEYLEQKAAA